MAKKKSTTTRTTPNKRVTKTETKPAPMVAQVQVQPQMVARGTWASVMSGTQDERVKPKSWSEWAREKLHLNRLK